MKNTELANRTLQFGIRCIKLAEALPKSMSGQVLAKQLIRSGTSVGANYRAACRARSRAEFLSKLGIVEEECDETLYWMEVISKLEMVAPSKLEKLRIEGDEILAITISSIKNRTPKRQVYQIDQCIVTSLFYSAIRNPSSAI